MKKTFNILIVDDDVLIARYLKDLLLASGYSAIRMAHSKANALSQMEEEQPDVVLLDIGLKSELDGIEIAETINANWQIPFLFITTQASKEVIEKALNTNPVSYITKPFKQADIYAAIHLIEKKIEANRLQYLIFKDGYTQVKLALDTILYVQSTNNYIHIFTSTKKLTLRNSLDWFKANTPASLFHRIHRSYIVNVTKISKSSSKSVFIGDVEIPVSRGNQVKLD